MEAYLQWIWGWSVLHFAWITWPLILVVRSAGIWSLFKCLKPIILPINTSQFLFYQFLSSPLWKINILSPCITTTTSPLFFNNQIINHHPQNINYHTWAAWLSRTVGVLCENTKAGVCMCECVCVLWGFDGSVGSSLAARQGKRSRVSQRWAVD